MPEQTKLTSVIRPNITEIAGQLGVNRTTVTRYITTGVRPSRRAGPRAPSIKLEATRLPGGWYVSPENIASFQDRLTSAWTTPGGAADIPTPAQMQLRIARNLQELDRLGLR